MGPTQVTCHLSHVMCIFLFVCFINWWSQLVKGLLSTGPTPSSLLLFTIAPSYLCFYNLPSYHCTLDKYSLQQGNPIITEVLIMLTIFALCLGWLIFRGGGELLQWPISQYVGPVCRLGQHGVKKVVYMMHMSSQLFVYSYTTN